MKITVTFRYRDKTVINIRQELEASEGYTAGDAADAVLEQLQKEQNLHFTGGNFAILRNGRIITPNHLLSNGDSLLIIPVAAGG